jgi:hypothetical protein
MEGVMDCDEAIEQARRSSLSYGVRILNAPDGRRLVILGETHLKLPEASRIGKEIVKAFALRGVETFPRKKVLGGELLKVVIEVPRLLLRVLSLGFVKGSTIVDARPAFALESVSRVPLGLHVASIYTSAFFIVSFAAPFWPALLPLAILFQWHLLALIPALLLQRRRWSWILHPMIAILTLRNATMAEGTAKMLAEHQGNPALVIMGRAHLPGYERELIENYGFSRSA